MMIKSMILIKEHDMENYDILQFEFISVLNNI